MLHWKVHTFELFSDRNNLLLCMELYFSRCEFVHGFGIFCVASQFFFWILCFVGWNGFKHKRMQVLLLPSDDDSLWPRAHRNTILISEEVKGWLKLFDMWFWIALSIDLWTTQKALFVYYCSFGFPKLWNDLLIVYELFVSFKNFWKVNKQIVLSLIWFCIFNFLWCWSALYGH